LGEQESALGRAWHLPTPAPTTARAFLAEVSQQVQRPVKALRLGPASARALGLAWPVLREGAEMLYQFRQPHSVDATRFRTAFGCGQVTSYTEGVARTLDHYRSNPGRPLMAMGT